LFYSFIVVFGFVSAYGANKKAYYLFVLLLFLGVAEKLISVADNKTNKTVASFFKSTYGAFKKGHK
jgi:hypothetical protein